MQAVTQNANFTLVTSRDNPQLKELRRLTQDSTAYRKQGRVWLEGDHLARAALQRGLRPVLGVYAESFWGREGGAWAAHAQRNLVLPDALFRDLSGLESPAPMAFGCSPDTGLWFLQDRDLPAPWRPDLSRHASGWNPV